VRAARRDIGLTVRVTARLCRVVGTDDVLATPTVRDLVVGSLLPLTPRCASTLCSVPGERLLFTASDQGC